LKNITFAAVDLGMNFFAHHPKQKCNTNNSNDNSGIVSSSSSSSSSSSLSYSSNTRSSSSEISDEGIHHKNKKDETAVNDGDIDSIIGHNCSMKKNKRGGNNSKKDRKNKKQVILGPVRNELDNEEQQGCIRVRRAAVGVHQEYNKVRYDKGERARGCDSVEPNGDDLIFEADVTAKGGRRRRSVSMAF